MRWKQEVSKLYERMRKNSGNPSETTFDKRLQRKSNNLGLASPAAALIVLAAEKKCGYSIEFNKLNEVQQTRVAQIINNLHNTSKTLPNNTVTKTKKRNIKSKFEINDASPFDPYLKQSLYTSIPQEGYSTMFILENSIRTFITRVLLNIHGKDWWNKIEEKKSLENIVEKVKKRKTTDTKNWYHSNRGAHNIYYTDYPELLKIIRALNSEFNNYFKKSPEKTLLEKLSELSPSRNVIAHNNPITKDDLNRLRVHSKDWFKYMQHLYK